VTSTVQAVGTPFSFFTVAHLTKIGNQCARTLTEFLKGLEECSDASIFTIHFKPWEATIFDRRLLE